MFCHYLAHNGCVLDRAVAAKVIVKTPPPAPAVEPPPAASTKTVSAPAKKLTKAPLKGVIMKKKSKPATDTKAPPDGARTEKVEHRNISPDPKRRKVAVES